MKFLIYGASGWIGKLLTDLLIDAADEVTVGRRIINITDILNDISEHHPDRVICCAARTCGPGNNSIDYLEGANMLHENIFCNLTAPVLIAQAASKHIPAMPVLYVGTGCIYEYYSNNQDTFSGYTEYDKPNFFGSAYSTVKGQTDQILQGFSNVLVARIRPPISEDSHPRDLVTKLVGYTKIFSVPNSVSVLPDILPFLLGCIVEQRAGTLNAVNPGVIDNHTILELYQRRVGVKLNYELCSDDKQASVLLTKRANNRLTTDKLESWNKSLQKDTRSKYRIPETILPALVRTEQIILGRIKERRVLLITGAAGFIGSNFVNFWLLKYTEDKIIGFDCLDKRSSLNNIQEPKHPRFHFFPGNLLDTQLLEDLLRRFAVTHVIHFAAASNVDLSFQDPLLFTSTNVKGTHSLLEAVRKYGKLTLLVHISTDEVYGEIEAGDATETTLFNPTNPYAATKAGAECLVMAYIKSYQVPCIITRANNVYGKFQYPAQVIPRFLFCLFRGKPMPIHGTGLAVRKYLHVLDKCRALELLVQNGKPGQIYNIGSRDEFSVLELARVLLRKVHGNKETLDNWITFVPDRRHNDCRYSVDYSKLSNLGWCPAIKFDVGIDETIAWYKENQNHWE